MEINEEVTIEVGDPLELVVVHATAEKLTDDPKHRIWAEIMLYRLLEQQRITKAPELMELEQELA